MDLQHANCSGGVAKATGATLAPFAAEAMANNPHMNSADLGRLYKKNVGLQAKPRTVRRHKKDALDAIQAADAGSIQQAPGYCRELVERSPGTVATVEVSCSVCCLKTAVGVRCSRVVRSTLFGRVCA